MRSTRSSTWRNRNSRNWSRALAVGIEGEPLTTRQVQIAVERLVTEQIIYQAGRGVYEIEDDQLAEWLRASPDLIEMGTRDTGG